MQYLYLAIPLVLSSNIVFAQQKHIAKSADSTVIVRLSEIDVNAGKEQADIKNVPAASTTLNLSNINSLQPLSLRDISGVAPNFYMSDHGSKLTSPTYVRGIGSRIGEPSIGLYVDGVACLDKSAFDFDFIDLQKVEVLRGPQGTLYGRNAMAGIVNIDTRSPLRNPGATASVTVGSYGQYNANAGIYKLISKKIGLSANAGYRHRDGFYDNEFDGSKTGRINTYSFRTKLEMATQGIFDFQNTASIEYSMQYGYPYAVYDIKTDKLNPINYNRESTYERTLVSDGLRMRWNWESCMLTSSSSYQYNDGTQSIDQDFTAQDIYFVVSRQTQHSAVEEITLKSHSNSKYRWVYGVFGLYKNAVSDVDANYYKLGYISANTATNGTWAASLFHQSMLVDLVKGLSITAGIRFDIENMSMDYSSYRATFDTHQHSNETYDEYPSQNWSEISPRLALSYDINSFNIYATIAKGYKAGGFNYSMSAEDIAAYPQYLTYDPERSWNYELGVKFGTNENLITGQASLFFIDWKNQHLYKAAPSKRGSMISNAGHTQSKGVELSLNMARIKGFDALLNVGYTYAEFVDYKKSETQKYDGNIIPYAPRQTIVAQVNKSFDLPSNVVRSIRCSVTYRGVGKIYWDETNISLQRYYDTVDVRATANCGSVAFGLWGRNIFDKEYQVFQFSLTSSSNFAQLGQPSSFGCFVTMRL